MTTYERGREPETEAERERESESREEKPDTHVLLMTTQSVAGMHNPPPTSLPTQFSLPLLITLAFE